MRHSTDWINVLPMLTRAIYRATDRWYDEPAMSPPKRARLLAMLARWDHVEAHAHEIASDPRTRPLLQQLRERVYISWASMNAEHWPRPSDDALMSEGPP